MKKTKKLARKWELTVLDSNNQWVIDQDGNYIAEIVDYDSEGRFILCDYERVKNGKLMAASPRLLEACKAAHKELVECYSKAGTRKATIKVINKLYDAMEGLEI